MCFGKACRAACAIRDSDTKALGRFAVNAKRIARLLGLVAAAAPMLAAARVQHLDIAQVTQAHSEWCWAADANAVLRYRGVSSTQCGIENWVDSIGYACERAPFYWNDQANSPNTLAGTTGIAGILWYLGRRDSQYYGTPLSFRGVAAAIHAGNPVVILWTWYGGGGHFVVIDGYDDRQQALYFMNPWPGEGNGYGSYNWIRYGSGNMGTHTWAESLVVY